MIILIITRMGLLTLLRKLKKTDQEARLLVLGLDNSGNTNNTLIPIITEIIIIIYNNRQNNNT